MNAIERPSALRLFATGVYLLAWPALVFWLAGDWRWPEAWVFNVWFVTMSVGCMAWLYVKDPALLAERYRMPGSGGQAGWDQLIVLCLAIGFIAWIAIMPLDARRFGWTSRWPLGVEAAGGALLLAAAFFLFRAFKDNTFASPLVRVQAERQHRVVSTGVYGFVRHPMYLGAVLMFFGAPLLLSSASGIAAAALLALVLARRIVGEEKLLAAELEGYADYRAKVRYRLLPGVW